ncbi:hypothetical protein AB0K51_05710 [Kitasatospora sp. NPDC049285]|uniref:hypothetical protein n=1 Tax=Kitasatospora sp. NPDC049285 TaxID=3157096 RepID=UPI00341E471F
MTAATHDAMAGTDSPLYLLVDRQRNAVVLYSHPAGGDYAASNAVPVGDPLPLPKPFGFDLATERLT